MLFSTSWNSGISVWLAVLYSTFMGQLCSRLLQTNRLYLTKILIISRRNILEEDIVLFSGQEANFYIFRFVPVIAALNNSIFCLEICCIKRVS